MTSERDTLEHAAYSTRQSVDLSDARPPIRRIAVLRALFLGDLLCSVPALRALRRRFPDAEIDLIGLPWADSLVHRLPYLNQLLPFPGYPGMLEVPYDKARTAAFVEQHSRAYDLLVQMHGDGRSSNGFVAALKPRYSLGYRRGDDSRLGYSAPYPHDEHEIRRWLDLVGLLGAAVDDTMLEFPIASHERRAAAALLGTLPPYRGPLVGIHAGANDPARRWPAERFAELAACLAQTHNATIVLSGSEHERELTGRIAAHISGTVLDLAGRTELGVLAALIERLDLLISNDTGAAHLATATGTPSVVLFGPGRVSEWGPLDRARHQVIDAKQLCDGDSKTALQNMQLEPVLRAVQHGLLIGQERHAQA